MTGAPPAAGALRVVSLLPSATELLFAIGAGPEVVGVTHECDHPAAVLGLPRLTSDLTPGGRRSSDIDRHIRRALHAGSGIYALDEQALAALRPDLVVTQELCEVCAVAYRTVSTAVRRLDAEVTVLSLEPHGLDDVLGTVALLGQATGHVAGAAALVDSLRARLAAVAALPPCRPRPRVVCLEWYEPLMAAGHWVPEVVERAGGEDVLGRAGERSAEVPWDAVLAAGPEVLVLSPCGLDLDRALELAAEVTQRPGFARLPAARSGRVLVLDGSAYLSRPGPRLVDGLEILATALRSRPGDPLPPGAAWLAGDRL